MHNIAFVTVQNIYLGIRAIGYRIKVHGNYIFQLNKVSIIKNTNRTNTWVPLSLLNDPTCKTLRGMTALPKQADFGDYIGYYNFKMFQ